MNVEELTQYGKKTLSGPPKEAMKKQKSIILREIRNKFGLIGIFQKVANYSMPALYQIDDLIKC